VATDLLGCGALYWTTQAGSVVVGSHLGHLREELEAAGSCPPIDRVGLAGFALGSISVDNRTPLEGVLRLPAAHYLRVELATGRVFVRKYAETADLVTGGAPVASADMAEMLRASARRESDVRGVLLSSGRDSFAVAASLDPSVRANSVALTYGSWRSRDLRESHAHARVLGLRHVRRTLHGFDPMVLSGFISAASRGASGLQTAQHLTGAMAMARHSPSAFVGFLGDGLSGKMFATAQPPESRLLSLMTPWLAGGAPSAREVLADEIRQIHEYARQAMRAVDAPPALAAALVYLTHRQAHWISGTFDTVGLALDVATPFFSRDLIRASLTTTLEPAACDARYEAMVREMGYFASRGSTGPVDRAARSVDRRRGPYVSAGGTVDWSAAIERARPRLLESAERISDSAWRGLAVASMTSGATLPLAMTVLPAFGLPTLDQGS
jgi:hypothetical protein